MAPFDRPYDFVLIHHYKYSCTLYCFWVISDEGGGKCDCRRLSVCLSVSEITQKRVDGFGWNFARRQVSGRGRTDQLLSPIWIIVRNRKIWKSKSVKQAPHSEQATGHECPAERYCLLHVVAQGPGSFPDLVDSSVRRTVAELRGVKLAQFKFSDFGLCRRYMRSAECCSSFRFCCKTV